MSTKKNKLGLKRSVVDWYANTLAAVLLLGAVTFVLLALQIGPTGVFAVFGLSLIVVFILLFGSLLTGSALVYESLLTGSALVYEYLGLLDDSA